MRVAKFRVWDNKEKVYLNEEDIAIDNLGNIFVFEGYDDNDADLWYARILPDSDNKRYIIEQSTGLKDKDDVEVYSGDIVERVSLGGSKRVVTGKILFDKRKSAFVWRVYEQGRRGFVEYYLNELAIDKTCKVISNIHIKYGQTLLR